MPQERQGHEGRLSAGPPQLRRSDLSADPLAQFDAWFGDAAAAGIPTPEAVALATATRDGRPSARMVLMRGHGADGFRFYTGYGSRKARELAENPVAALLFHWQDLGRQVRVEGPVSVLDAAASDDYFASRPRESRLSAWASEQGRVLEGRAELDAALASARRRFGDGPVPRPERWGGYLLAPDAYEFWQHGEHRLHDRFRYVPDGSGGWRIERLAP